MLKFGPSGNSSSFFDEGFSSSLDAPKWLRDKGLDIYEYSFGRGVRIGEKHARAIGEEAKNNSIEISVHSPYYINFASNIEENVINSIGYMMKSIETLKYFNGNRVVVHPGSPLKQDRKTACNMMIRNFTSLAEMIIDSGPEEIIICPETMGKVNQMGTLEEILKICSIADFYIPCIDFGHINSRYNGYFENRDNYKAVFDEIFNAIGEERGRKIHMHFSHIEYGKLGEIRHLTFNDDKFGPFFEDLAPILIDYKIEGYLLSESAGTQAEDALYMKKVYNDLLE